MVLKLNQRENKVSRNRGARCPYVSGPPPPSLVNKRRVEVKRKETRAERTNKVEGEAEQKDEGGKVEDVVQYEHREVTFPFSPCFSCSLTSDSEAHQVLFRTAV